MATTAADVLVDTLIEWGVEFVFGLPGDGINGIVESLRTRQKQIRFIQVRHEETAAFMACGYAKFTGKLGVCLATSGPGGVHLLNGLYDAKFDGQPVLAITGMHFHDLISTHTQQDVELDKLFEDVSVYNARVMGPSHVENVMELACRKAMAYKGVAHVTIPVDFQSMAVARSRASSRNRPGHAKGAMAFASGLPSESDLSDAAAILNEGKNILVLAGRGALGARDELLTLADRLGAPIAKPLLGKAVVPDDSVLTIGSIGFLGTRPSAEAVSSCDTLLLVGTSFPYIEFLPQPGQARAVQIDHDPTRIGLRYPAEVGLVGDSKKILEQLLPLLRYNPSRDFLRKAQEGMHVWWEQMKIEGTKRSLPMKPQVVAWELGKRLREDAILCCDSGTVATWWARQIPARGTQMHSLSGTLATMACGLPYAMAAQLGHPGRQVVAFVGDGAFSMLMADFATCVKYRLPIKVVVLKNNSLGQIKWEQMAFLGNPEFACDLQPIDFVAFSQACGGQGFLIEDPEECGDLLEEALEVPGPVLIEARVDPLEPPMPGKLRPSQALHFAQSILKGTPHAAQTVRTIARDQLTTKFKEWI